MKQVYLDTNFFVALYEGDEKASRAAWALMNLSGSKIQFITSELSLAEVLIQPLRKMKDVSLVDLDDRGLSLTPGTLGSFYLEILTDRDELSVVTIDRSILILSAHFRAEIQSLRLPDAIHLATAQQKECEIVVSGDKRLRSSSAFSFQRVGVTPYELDKFVAELA